MSRIEILKKITEYLSDITDDESLELSEDMTADDVPDWDSMNHIKLIVALEKDLGIRFDTLEINQTNSVKQIIDMVQRKL